MNETVWKRENTIAGLRATFNKRRDAFKALEGTRFIDDRLYLCAGISQIYIQSGRYSTPCRIYGARAELYINGTRRAVFIETDMPGRCDFKVGTLDEHGYFHYTAGENAEGVTAA